MFYSYSTIALLFSYQQKVSANLGGGLDFDGGRERLFGQKNVFSDIHGMGTDTKLKKLKECPPPINLSPFQSTAFAQGSILVRINRSDVFLDLTNSIEGKDILKDVRDNLYGNDSNSSSNSESYSNTDGSTFTDSLDISNPYCQTLISINNITTEEIFDASKRCGSVGEYKQHITEGSFSIPFAMLGVDYPLDLSELKSVDVGKSGMLNSDNEDDIDSNLSDNTDSNLSDLNTDNQDIQKESESLPHQTPQEIIENGQYHSTNPPPQTLYIITDRFVGYVYVTKENHISSKLCWANGCNCIQTSSPRFRMGMYIIGVLCLLGLLWDSIQFYLNKDSTKELDDKKSKDKKEKKANKSSDKDKKEKKMKKHSDADDNIDTKKKKKKKHSDADDSIDEDRSEGDKSADSNSGVSTSEILGDKKEQ